MNSNLKMKDLVLPGVHHHGLVEGAARYEGPIPGGKVQDWAVTQSLSVTDQLRTGARFLDVRLTVFRGRIYTAHGTNQNLLTIGVLFEDLLKDNIDFLNKNHGEFLVWTFTWEYGQKPWHVVEQILNRHKAYFYTDDENPLEQTLSTLAGKIVICKEGENNLRVFRKLDCLGSWLSTKDKDPNMLVKRITQYAKSVSGIYSTPQPQPFFNYIEAIATIDVLGVLGSVNIFTTDADNLKDLACEVNKELKESFLTKENRNLSKNINAVMVDYSVYHQVIPGILDFNAYKSSQN